MEDMVAFNPMSYIDYLSAHIRMLKLVGKDNDASNFGWSTAVRLFPPASPVPGPGITPTKLLGQAQRQGHWDLHPGPRGCVGLERPRA